MMNKILSGTRKNSLYFLATLLFLTSCQRKFASFQASSRETFEHQPIPRIKETTVPKIEKIPDPVAEPENNDLVSTAGELPVYHIPEVRKIITAFRKKPANQYIKTDAHQKVFQKEKPKKKKKNKRKRPTFNDGLKTGTIFLLIAVIMGIFSLTQLTLLFGLVSVLFLYFGLKKYYRQQRRRNIFK